jgi:hypothetical protein
MKVIQPFNLNINEPTIFLAGPIQDAPEWHQEIIKLLNNKLSNKNVVVASPKILGEKPSEWTYIKQVNWESEYLNKAAKKGIILFWLPNSATQNLERSYAQTTRFELSEWFTKHKIDNSIKIVIGIEPGFHGERYIKYRINEESDIPLFDNIVDLTDYVIGLF